MEDIKIKSSVLVRSDQPIVAERHMHSWYTAIVDLPGASEESGHVGIRLYFSQRLQAAQKIGSVSLTSERMMPL